MSVYTLQPTGFTQNLARLLLRMRAWRLEINLPASEKYVLLGAPHTSSWDLLYALLLQHAAGIKMHWIGKDDLFRWPINGLMRWLGGIPVNRRSRNNFVQQVVDIFNHSKELVVVIAPEGTRTATQYWKTGFYHIAFGAKVPIAMGFIDYRTRTLGIGPSIIPSGDIRLDFNKIRAFYSGIRGKRPEKQGEIRLRDETVDH